MKLRYLLLFTLIFKNLYAAKPNMTITCPSEIYEINDVVVSLDKQWIQLPDSENGNISSEIINKNLKKIENDKTNTKTAVNLFTVTIDKNYTMCILIGKINPRLYYLVTDQVYLPANQEKWVYWNNKKSCGNSIPETGKPLPIDYCLFKLSPKAVR